MSYILLFLTILGGYGTIGLSMVLVKRLHEYGRLNLTVAAGAAFCATVTVVCAQRVMP